MVVRYAGKAAKAEEEDTEAKLYVAMLARDSNETDLRNLFEPFGVIKEVVLLRHLDTGVSKCTFIGASSPCS